MMVAIENERSRFNAALGLVSQGFSATCQYRRTERTPCAAVHEEVFAGTARCCSPSPTRSRLGRQRRGVVQERYLRWSAARCRRRGPHPRAYLAGSPPGWR